MSTIAYRNGEMVADTRAWAGSRMPIGRKKKIHRLKDGSLLGISSSDVGAPESFIRWANEVDEPEVSETENAYDIQALLVKPDGRVYFWNEGNGFSGPLEGEFFALGSGELAALGAMFMGADARKAVAVACEVDYCSALPLFALKLKED